MLTYCWRADQELMRIDHCSEYISGNMASLEKDRGKLREVKTLLTSPSLSIEGTESDI